MSRILRCTPKDLCLPENENIEHLGSGEGDPNAEIQQDVSTYLLLAQSLNFLDCSKE